MCNEFKMSSLLHNVHDAKGQPLGYQSCLNSVDGLGFPQLAVLRRCGQALS